MKSLLFAALLMAACAAPSSEAGGPGHGKVGMGGGGFANYWIASLAPVTGNNATIIVFDTTVTATGADRFELDVFYDQAVTVLHQIRITGSLTWRTVNGNGSGDTVSASTLTVLDYLRLAKDDRIEVVTGSTGPTTSETMVGVIYDRPLAM